MMQPSHISVKPPRFINLDDDFDAEVIEFSLDDLQNNRRKTMPKGTLALRMTIFLHETCAWFASNLKCTGRSLKDSEVPLKGRIG